MKTWKFESIIKSIVKKTKKKILKKKKKILFLTSIPSFNSVNLVDQSLAAKFKTEGADIGFVWCGGERSICHKFKFKKFSSKEIKSKRRRTCINCQEFGKNKKHYVDYAKHFFINKMSIFDKLNFFFKKKNKDEYKFIKDIAFSTSVRMSAKGKPDDFFFNEQRKYFFEIYSYYKNLSKILKKFSPDICIIHHGIYFPQGIAVYLCKKFNIKFFTYWSAYKKNSYLFVEGDTYHKVMPNEKQISKVNINKNEVTELENYINLKENSDDDWINFHGDSNKNFNYYDEYDLLCTNVTWDAKIHFENSIFLDQEEWVEDTIKFYLKNKKKLIIRCHPAEIKGYIPSREPIEKIIQLKFKNLNEKFIKIINSDEKISTIELVKKSKRVLIYGSKVSIDACVFNKPVIIAGDAWAKNKGFTFDAKNKENYFELLKNEKLELTDEQLLKAKKYAFNFYFERPIKLDYINKISRSEYTIDENKYIEFLNNDGIHNFFLNND